MQPKFRKKAERLLAAAKIRADWGGAPSAEAGMERDEERMLSDPIWQGDPGVSEPEVIGKLVENFSIENHRGITQCREAKMFLLSCRPPATSTLSIVMAMSYR